MTGDQRAADHAQAKFELEEMRQEHLASIAGKGLSVIKVE